MHYNTFTIDDVICDSIRDPHACPLNDLYVSWEIPDPCATRIF